MMRAIVLLFLGGLCHITSSQKCTKAVDIGLVVDESGSIKAHNFIKIKKFLSEVVTGFNVASYGAHFGIIKYSGDSELVCPLNKYTNVNQLQQRILNMAYDTGGTNTGAAFRFARQNLFVSPADRKNVPNVLILFSDGESNDHNFAKQEANLLKQNGVEVLCVAIGNGQIKDSLRKQLQELASKTNYLFETTFDLLYTIKNELTKETCDAVAYKKEGCFEMEKANDFRVLLFSRRNILDNYWEVGWDNFLDKIVNDCYKKAKDQNKLYFWVEFYAECYGVDNLDIKVLKKSSESCWSKRPDYTECNPNELKPICVGIENHGFVYKVNY